MEKGLFTFLGKKSDSTTLFVSVRIIRHHLKVDIFFPKLEVLWCTTAGGLRIDRSQDKNTFRFFVNFFDLCLFPLSL